MTTLTIIPDYDKKRLKCVGRIAAGEHVDVSVLGGWQWAGTGNSLRLRFLFGRKTMAIFPYWTEVHEEDGTTVPADAWGQDSESLDDATCVLNLNTVPMQKLRFGGTCLVVLDDAENHTLYGTCELEISAWPKRRGEDVPYSLDEYPDIVGELRERIEDAEAEVETQTQRAVDAEAAIRSAVAEGTGIVDSAKGFRDEAESAKTDAVSAKEAAESAAEDLQDAVNAAKGHADDAKDAKDAAVAAKNAAEAALPLNTALDTTGKAADAKAVGDAINAEKTRAMGIEAGLRTDVNAKASATDLTNLANVVESEKADKSEVELVALALSNLIGSDEARTVRDVAADEVAKIVNNAPESFDTLKEVADWIAQDPSRLASLASRILALENTKFTDDERQKLANIEAGANAYVLPPATASTLGGVKQGTGCTIAPDGTISVTGGEDKQDALYTETGSAAGWSFEPNGYGATQELADAFAEDNADTFTAEVVGSVIVCGGYDAEKWTVYYMASTGDQDPTDFSVYVTNIATSASGMLHATYTEGGTRNPVPAKVDTTPTADSPRLVTSGGIWSAIWGALSALPTGFASLYDWVVAQLANKRGKSDLSINPGSWVLVKPDGTKVVLDWDAAVGFWEGGEDYLEFVSGTGLWALGVGETVLDRLEAPADSARLVFHDGTDVYRLYRATELATNADLAEGLEGKQDALSAQQLANIAAVPGKADAADLRYSIAEAVLTARLPAGVTPWVDGSPREVTIEPFYDGWHIADPEIDAIWTGDGTWDSGDHIFRDSSGEPVSPPNLDIVRALADRAINVVSLFAAATLTMPAANAGYARDLVVRLTVGADGLNITWGTADAGGVAVDYETEDGEFPDLSEAGTYLVRLTETAAFATGTSGTPDVPAKFLIQCQTLQTAAAGGAA